MYEYPLDKYYESHYKKYISPIGIVYSETKDEFFDNIELIKQLIPKLVIPTKNTIILNSYCHSSEGPLETFNKIPYPTYNKDNFQKYQHFAWDYGNFPFDYFKETDSCMLYSPFKNTECIVYDIQNIDYPKKDGAKEDYAQKGIVLTLGFKLSEKKEMDTWFKIEYCHLDEVYVNQGDIIKPGQLIAKLGFTGYTGFLGQHTHVEYHLFGRRIDPFKYKAIYNQDEIVKTFSYIPHPKKHYPEDYKWPKYTSLFKSYISFENKNYGNIVEITPGTYTYYLLTETPVKDVLMTENPYGPINPINWNGTIGQWASKFLNKLLGKSGIYLFDVADIHLYNQKTTYKYYIDEDRNVYPRKKKGLKEVSKDYYLTTFTVTSDTPYSNDGYGNYYYYPITEDGKLGYQFTIKLRKE